MRRNHALKTAVRCVVASALLLVTLMAAFIIEQRRTQAEFGVVLSAYLSHEILHDAHDWGSGCEITVVLQREVQQPATWRFRRLILFDHQAHLAEASSATRASFIVNNALPSTIHVALRLPPTVKARDGEFQRRFLHNLEYIAVSQAGFNAAKTEALFYIDHFCGLCGGGGYVLMRKAKGSCVVVDQHGTWAS